MGYYMFGRSKDFKIRRENFKTAYEHVKDSKPELMGEGNLTLAHLLGWQGFTVYHHLDSLDEDIIELWFPYDRSTEEHALLEAIAPWVEDGSYIEMEGEERWVWYFLDGKLHHAPGVVTYPDMYRAFCDHALLKGMQQSGG